MQRSEASKLGFGYRAMLFGRVVSLSTYSNGSNNTSTCFSGECLCGTLKMDPVD